MTSRLSYQQLLQQKDAMPCYADLLQTEEWWAKRQQVLERDSYICSHCKKSETLLWPHAKTGEYLPHDVIMPENWASRTMYFVNEQGLQSFRIYNPHQVEYVPAGQIRKMHVHHSLYIYGRLPWEYADTHLQTLCDHCHYQWHQRQQATVYMETESGLVEMTSPTPCMRCHGAGCFPHYKHVEGGICFRCRGACFEEWMGNLHIQTKGRFVQI